MTGYRMICTVGDADENGCEVTYLTQSDPKGRYSAHVAFVCLRPKGLKLGLAGTYYIFLTD